MGKDGVSILVRMAFFWVVKICAMSVNAPCMLPLGKAMAVFLVTFSGLSRELSLSSVSKSPSCMQSLGGGTLCGREHFSESNLFSL